MTLTELLLSCKADLGYGTIPTLSDETGTRLTRYINDGYRQIMRLPGFEMLRFQTHSFSTKPGLAYYSAGAAEQIYAVVSAVSQQRLTEMSRDSYRSIDPSETVSGTPWAWVPDGFHIQSRPTTDYLYALSGDAVDTTQHLTGTFIAVDNSYRSFDIQLNGKTSVNLTPDMVNIPAPKELLTMQLSAPCVGTVVIVDVVITPPALPTEWIAAILPGRLSTQIIRMRFWPTPTDSLQYNADVQLPMAVLVASTDVPVLPVDFHNLLSDYAKMREYELRGDDRFEQSAALYNDGLKALKNRVTNSPDYRPVAGKYRVSPGSNLGPYYPGGRW